MKQQEDSPDRRGMSRLLFAVLCGVESLSELRAEMRLSGLDLRQLTLPNGGERFIVTELCNGRVYDSFTFYGEEMLGGFCGFEDFEEED